MLILFSKMLVSFILFFFFFWAVSQTRGFLFARQVLYHRVTASDPACSVIKCFEYIRHLCDKVIIQTLKEECFKGKEKLKIIWRKENRKQKWNASELSDFTMSILLLKLTSLSIYLFIFVSRQCLTMSPLAGLGLTTIPLLHHPEYEITGLKHHTSLIAKHSEAKMFEMKLLFHSKTLKLWS